MPWWECVRLRGPPGSAFCSSVRAVSLQSYSLAAGVVPELAADPVAFVRAASDAGWRACGVWFDPETWTEATSREMRAVLDDTGIVPLDLEVIRLGQGDHRPAVETARALGIPNVLCISMLDDGIETVARYAELCADCGAVGVRACLEFMPFSSVRGLRDALDVIAAVDHAAAAVLVDTLHLIRSGGSIDDVRSIDPALVPYAQWCDGLASLDDASRRGLVLDALEGRSCPGEGEFPVDEFVAALPALTPLSLEIRSAALRDAHPDPTSRARAVLAAVTARR
ncbi:hypothetical protein BH23ACT3_BH23ACT3_03150 [soil metagenome]